MFDELKYKSQSPLETRFAEDCTVEGLKVIPQFKIGKIHADFAIPEKNLVIELDSEMYHSSDESILKDWDRDEIYKSFNWNILRINGPMVYKHGSKIIQEIMAGKFDEGGNITMYNEDDYR